MHVRWPACVFNGFFVSISCPKCGIELSVAAGMEVTMLFLRATLVVVYVGQL